MSIKRWFYNQNITTLITLTLIVTLLISDLTHQGTKIAFQGT